MEIRVNFVLFEELKGKPDGSGAETRIMIARVSQDMDSALNSAFDTPE